MLALVLQLLSLSSETTRTPCFFFSAVNLHASLRYNLVDYFESNFNEGALLAYFHYACFNNNKFVIVW